MPLHCLPPTSARDPLVGTAVDGTAADDATPGARAERYLAPPVLCPPCPPRCRCSPGDHPRTALPCARSWAACKLFGEGDGAAGQDEPAFRGGRAAWGDPCCWATPRSHRVLYASRQAWIDAACGKAVRPHRWAGG